MKIHINSTISRAKKNAKYMCIDIKNFYLGTPMKYFQYRRNHKKFIPQEVVDKYDIIFDDQYFTYVEICRGMYGLKEAGVIAFDQLVRKIKHFGYKPMPQTLDSGDIPHAKQLSHSASTTSASSTSQKPTPTT